MYIECIQQWMSESFMEKINLNFINGIKDDIKK